MTSDHSMSAASKPEQSIDINPSLPLSAPVTTPLTIIGIGASAGGLTALRNFLQALPADSGLTFVIVVHLSPEHESVLAELLQPYTAMPVLQVNERIAMQPNHVYVIPPAKSLVVSDNALDLQELTTARGRPMQIDSFFRSLAEDHGDGGAIILSGSGSDGAVGIQAIKEKGGLLLVQSPTEAEYDGMPRSAIATGLVDIVGTVAELATQLVAAKQLRLTVELPRDGEPLSAVTEEALHQILTQLRLRTGHDFSGYKRATLLRRLARRMQLTQSTTLTAYLQRLRQDTDEADALFSDLLINVTEFFRDRDAWLTLETTVIPQLFAGKGQGDSVRVWTVGCATGEEAYSLAMLLLEYATALAMPPTIQIFASDLGKSALDFARASYYPEAIAGDLTEERLSRFFTKENSHYRVRPEIRETILFTQHNLLQDPPFSRLDLIICRNLLIYIQRELQEKIFETFSYALRPSGYLFLGNAESADGASNLFDTVDKRHRLYQRRVQSHPAPLLPALPLLSRLAHRLPASSTGTAQPPPEEHRLLLETDAPPSVLIDQEYRLLHLSESAGRYLLTPGGQPTTDLLKVVRPELQIELRAALFRAFDEGKSTFTSPVPVQFNGAPHLVYLFVRPRAQAGGAMRALVLFLEDERPVTPAPLPSSATTETVHQLASELRHTQERLQGAREAYETTVEELRAANEELQSTNEEYKSTLEELETSKEELQSINEELQTINQELKSKVEEVTQAHDDLQNLFVATNIATLFLDRRLQVKRYTPRAADLFNLMPPDRGRPIAHLRANLHYPQLEADAQQVLQSLTPTEREVTSQTGRWYLVQVRPYRTMDDRIDGVAITFVDITAIKQTEEALRNSEAHFRSALGAMLDAALLLTPIYDATQTISDFRIDFASRVALDVAQRPHDEFVGRRLTAIFPAIAATGLLATYRQVFQSQTAVTELFYYQDTVGAYTNGRWIEAHLSPMQEGIIAVWHDVTAWKEAEAGLRSLNETLEERVVERTTQVRALASTLTLAEQEERRRISQILHDDLQQRLYGIQMRVLSIITDVAANNQSRLSRYAQEVYGWIGDAIQTTRQLTVDLSPPVLRNEGLADALAWLASQMAAVNGLQVEIRAPRPWIVLQEDMRVLLFQSVRELLFNVVKHAATDHATVELTETTNGELQIVVRDEGRGFDTTAVNSKQAVGFGLYSVRERLNLFGGRLTIASTPGQGTEITIHAPIASS
jgi:two-component system CheB/CheR fusion protein